MLRARKATVRFLWRIRRLHVPLREVGLEFATDHAYPP